MLPLHPHGLLLVLAASPVHLGDLLAEARKNNPELAAARAEVAAAEQAVEGAAALDDPMLSLQLWQAPIDFSTVPVMVQLSQNLPLGGKRGAKRDAANGEAARARADAATRVREIETAVAKAYFDMFLADRTLEVDDEVAATLEALLAAASSRIAAGKGEQAEALRAQADLLKVRSDREQVLARQVAARSKLVALLNRDPSAELGPATEPGLLDDLPPASELTQRGLRDRPELQALDADIARADAELRLARAERVPDLGVFVAEMHSFRAPGVADFVTVGVQGNLPIFFSSKNRSRIEAASARVTKVQAERKGLQNRIAAEISDASAEVTAERHQVLLHHQLIPVAKQALSSALASYAAGRGGFPMVLDSERDLLMHSLDLAQHVTMYEQRLAELQLAVGGDVGLERAAESGTKEVH